MIKAAAVDKHGRPIVIVGLSVKNMEHLQNGRPIEMNLTDFGSEGILVIMGGETEAAIMAELSSLLGPPEGPG
jgi:hypothetical protein